MGVEHDNFSTLNAIIDKVMSQDIRRLVDVLVSEVPLW
jgi:hypothetical protein